MKDLASEQDSEVALLPAGIVHVYVWQQPPGRMYSLALSLPHPSFPSGIRWDVLMEEV